MLTPINNSTSVTATSSKKLTTIDKPYLSLGPDFFKPLTTETGLSCTYPPEFYEAFGQNSRSSQHSELAMLVLEYITLQDKARLPLFTNASDRYLKQVLPAIQEKLASNDMDTNTLTTKIYIMNCASRLGYLTRSSPIFQGIVTLNHVRLAGIDLRDAYLANASLIWAKLSEVNLSGANLSHANLSGADLSKANLNGANLSEANLSNSNLSGANLAGANISRALLRKADLRGANLHQINLKEADFTGTKLCNTNRLLLVEISKEMTKSQQ